MLTEECEYSIEYITGLLNSKIYQWRFKATSTNNNVATNELEAMPFRKIDFENSNDISLYKRVVLSVRQLMKLNEQVHNDGGSDQRRYAAMSTQLKVNIDEAIAKLFEISEFHADC